MHFDLLRRGRKEVKLVADASFGPYPLSHGGQLQEFLVWLASLVVGFAFIEVLTYAQFEDTGAGIAGLTLLAYGALLLVSIVLVHRGHQRSAVVVVCSGFLAATLIVAVAQSFLIPVLILAPLLAVGIALPIASERTLRYMFAAAWLVAVALAVVGEVADTSSSLPGWYQSTFLVAALTMAVATVLVLLWQFRSRLMGTLHQVREAQVQAVHDATHDALTGLPNRSLFMERLGRTLERANTERGYLFALLFLDLDRFKNINDSLGHVAGDLLLIETASRLRACVHSTDTVARLGGDEFTILLEDIESADHALQVADRIHQRLDAPFEIGDHKLYITASVGIVSDPTGYLRAEGLLRDADTAMYQAKEDGKARHRVFETYMRDRAMRLLRLETELRRAVEQEEFAVHYQPVVRLRSGEVSGFEALVRWDHPERGIISPREFISVAEETELVRPIGLYVLGEACSRAREWHERFPDRQPVSVSVNVAPVQFTHPEFAGQVERALQETGLDGRHLQLEVTETTLLTDTIRALEILRRLRGSGVRVHIDDFGTGYSSLGLLHRFPVDALKIDRTFVGGPEDEAMSSENIQIAQTIVTLAHGLGMDVIAEGTSTQQHLARLREIGCDYAQGYLFSEPVDARSAGEIISAASR